MARRGGDLYPLTIAAIFLVVFTLMWAGVQHTRGELVSEQPIDDRERTFRATLWTAIDDWRADRDVGTTRKVTRVSAAAQEAAVVFAAGNRTAGAETITGAPQAGLEPEVRHTCIQVLVSTTVSRNGWNATGGAFDSAATAVADDTVARLAARDPGALRTTGPVEHGLGVAIDGPVLHVVYRTCSTRRSSP